MQRSLSFKVGSLRTSIINGCCLVEDLLYQNLREAAWRRRVIMQMCLFLYNVSMLVPATAPQQSVKMH